MGVVEELGSGMRKMFKYTPLYANGKEPIIEEHDVYRIEIPYISTLLGSDNETTRKTTQKTTRKMLAYNAKHWKNFFLCHNSDLYEQHQPQAKHYRSFL